MLPKLDYQTLVFRNSLTSFDSEFGGNIYVCVLYTEVFKDVALCFRANSPLTLQKRALQPPSKAGNCPSKGITLHPRNRGELSYLAPLGSENISAPYFKQCFFRGGVLPPPD